jgi:hypothetical protein
MAPYTHRTDEAIIAVTTKLNKNNYKLLISLVEAFIKCQLAALVPTAILGFDFVIYTTDG